MDEVFAALTCGAPDKERPASDAGEKKKKTKDKNAALKYRERNEENRTPGAEQRKQDKEKK